MAAPLIKRVENGRNWEVYCTFKGKGEDDIFLYRVTPKQRDKLACICIITHVTGFLASLIHLYFAMCERNIIDRRAHAVHAESDNLFFFFLII